MDWNLDPKAEEILNSGALSAIEKQNLLWGLHIVLRVEELIDLCLVESTDTETILDLIFNEIRLREPIHPDQVSFIEREYQSRFPALSQEIQKQFQCDKELASCFDDRQVGRPCLPQEHGVQIPGYEIKESVGSGGFGTVYKAEQLELGRTVAIKVLQIQDIQAKSPFDDFRNEALKVSRLFHKNIIEIYEIGEQADFFYIVMPFVAGGSLTDNRERLKDDFFGIARIVADVSRALQYAHDLSILHCDVTPNNILLSPGNRPLLVDFGLSKDSQELSLLRSISNLSEDFDKDHQSHDVSSGIVTVGGTPGFMSPEQYCGDVGSLSVRTDVFGLGGVLLFLLTGRHSNEYLTEKVSGDHRSDENSMPPDLWAIIRKCVSTNAEERYAKAEELAQDLERFLGNEVVLARPLRGLRNAPERFSKWMKRSPVEAAWSLFSALLGGILLLTMTASFVWVTRKSGEMTIALKDTAVVSFDLGKLAATNGTAQQAVDSYTKAISVQEQLVRLFPGVPEYRLMLSKTECNLATILAELSESVQASTHFEQSIRTLVESKPVENLHAEWYSQLADVHENFGNHLRQIDRREDALKQYLAAFQIRNEVYSPDSPQGVFAEAKSLMSFAGLKSLDSHSMSQAVEDYKTAIRKLENLDSAGNRSDDAFERLQIAYMNLANLQPFDNESGNALLSLQETIDKWDTTLKSNPGDHQARRLYALCLMNSGYELSQQGEYGQAIARLKDARSQFIRVLESEEMGLLSEIYYCACLNFLSNTSRILAQNEYQDTRRLEILNECESYSKESVRRLLECVNRNRFLYESKSRLTEAFRNLAGYHLVTGDLDLAVQHYRAALDLINLSAQPTITWKHERVAICNDLSRALLDSPGSHSDEAKRFFIQGLEEAYSLVPGEQINAVVHPLLQVLHDGLGLLFFREGYSAADPALAKEAYLSSLAHYGKSIEVAERLISAGKLKGDYRRILNETYGRRATVFDLVGNYTSSIKDWSILVKRGDPKHPDHILFRLSLAIALAKDRAIKSAWDELSAIESILPTNANAPFMAACCLCVIYRQIGLNDPVSMEVPVSKNALLSRAVALLETAESLGFFSTKEGIVSLQSEPDLSPIRDFEQFRAFLDRILEKSDFQQHGDNPPNLEP